MMHPCTSLALDLASSLDPVRFQQRQLTATLPELDQWQVDGCKASASNLLLLCGRQTGKSTFASLIAIWQVVNWPGTLVLLISPTLRQSGELFRKCMELLDSLPDKPKELARSKTELKLKNGSHIVSLPGANPDAIRGYSAPDLIIEDEAAFVNDRTFIASRPMLATNEHGRHILLTTPYGRRGHFHELWMSDDPSWQRISIKSADCKRISADFLETEQRLMSKRAYQQEYECKFLEAANAVFPADLIERLVDDDERHDKVPDAFDQDGAPVIGYQEQMLRSIMVVTDTNIDLRTSKAHQSDSGEITCSEPVHDEAAQARADGLKRQRQETSACLMALNKDLDAVKARARGNPGPYQERIQQLEAEAGKARDELKRLAAELDEISKTAAAPKRQMQTSDDATLTHQQRGLASISIETEEYSKI